MVVEGGRELTDQLARQTTVGCGEEALADFLVGLLGQAVVE